MRIMIDQAIPFAPGLFAQLGEVHTFDGRSLWAPDLADTDALIVRSVTQVDATLLAGSKVRFVGTATSGTDHVDEAWLAQEGIQFAAARGCNARPVAEYVLTAILWLARHRQFDPRTKTLGVVGVGHTGSLVAQWAHALGMAVLLCDPPLQEAGRNSSLLLPPERPSPDNSEPRDDSQRPNNSLANRLPVSPPQPPSPRREPGVQPPPLPKAPSPQWLSQPDLLAQSDIITLHVPLTLEGLHATREMVNPCWLAAMKPGSMLINAARGEVVVESALIEARRGGRLSGLVVDVWTGEPAINEEFAAACDIATPHIAGYSVEAKRRAVATIHGALAAWAGISATPEPPSPSHSLSPTPPPATPSPATPPSPTPPSLSPTPPPAIPSSVIPTSASRAVPVSGPVPVPHPVSAPKPDPFSRDPTGSASATPTPPTEARPSARHQNQTPIRTNKGRRYWDISDILDLMETACPLSNIDAGLRAAIADGKLTERFDTLRSGVSQRREFPDHRLNTTQFATAAAEYLEKVGFASGFS